MKYFKHIFLNAMAGMLSCIAISLQAQTLYLSPGSHLVMNGSPLMILNNFNLLNDGSFTAGNSTVIFTGNTIGTNAFIGGKTSTSFYNFTISKSFKDVQLNNDITVSGNVIMNQGNLQLNGHNLDLERSGNIIGEKNSSYITDYGRGTIRITTLLNSLQAINPGNIGIEITSPSNLGLTVITRGHALQNNLNSGYSIRRYFDISPAITTRVDVKLRFYFLENELMDKNENDLTIFSKMEDRNWSSLGKDVNGLGINWVVKSNIHQLHRFTLGVAANPANSKMTNLMSAKTYPNPTTGDFQLTLVSLEEKDQMINLYNQLGQQLESKKIHLNIGTNYLQWNIHRYTSGTYFLGYENSNINLIKIVKE